MSFLIDFILHIDTHLVSIVSAFGDWTYLILFAIIFIETGAVILPFLPGDSLLFAAAALSANPMYGLNIWIFVFLLFLAAVLGDSTNFFIGRWVGNTLTEHHLFGKFINEQKLEESRNFLNHYGSISITFARYMPIIRTFAPFVAGGSQFKYRKFIVFNMLGASTWVALCCGAGYFFGNFPIVKQHFSAIVIGIILISLIPILISFLKARKSA
ncbi:VTT domain-containing protein [Pediococcus inopinatus]|uniref:VTT domain-containing protein n=1 Tax=Pediococcus inopinatus TaxID=114090 RepID=A0ABZ0Q4K1_9LACO|nr:VTT domain-containing protein [Pediococcus inopinatus]AVL00209.1 cytochrome O ubiquinol oxidase [Pediococcus inopinatus]KRN60463.1 DedA family membrane protein [Pediococcus inopinatus]WPC17870.1 VTT domain-containing protein [Pediococcus inopinatus]WPC19329.1 VTT domain-containing protein [Pediococcus inopinatus]WPC21120.1 VTT domain-containing protein [Pediococcus inopinatus]